MQHFVHNENLKRFRERLEHEPDPDQRALLERLIVEEENRELSKPRSEAGTGDGVKK